LSTSRIAIARLLAGLGLLPGLATAVDARPEHIREGLTYYSDAADSRSEADAVVRDLVGEKNYEEVYQLYRYYEAIYDDEGRVLRFREYLRGEPVRTETYVWGEDGRLLERTVEGP
jgi:hypothetical protein